MDFQRLGQILHDKNDKQTFREQWPKNWTVVTDRNLCSNNMKMIQSSASDTGGSERRYASPWNNHQSKALISMPQNSQSPLKKAGGVFLDEQKTDVIV